MSHGLYTSIKFQATHPLSNVNDSRLYKLTWQEKLCSWLNLPLSCNTLAEELILNISLTLGCQWTKSFLQVPCHVSHSLSFDWNGCQDAVIYNTRLYLFFSSSKGWFISVLLLALPLCFWFPWPLSQEITSLLVSGSAANRNREGIVTLYWALVRMHLKSHV